MRVAVVRGDGIGPEVIGHALAELGAGAELLELEVGADRWLRSGETLTDDDLEALRGCDAILFGAIGDPRVPAGILETEVLLRLRRELDLYVNLRPFPEIDVVVVRENTEGLYAGRGASTEEEAHELSVNTRRAIARCAAYAYETAARRSGRLTLVHKTNVLRHAGALWRSVTEELQSEYPDVQLGYEHVDAACYHLVCDPSRFDVIVTDNMFGDILSDVAAAVAGGLGCAASANLHPDPATRPTRCIGLFEPVHGSAPDIAGTGTADPTGAVRAVRMLNEALLLQPVAP